MLKRFINDYKKKGWVYGFSWVIGAMLVVILAGSFFMKYPNFALVGMFAIFGYLVGYGNEREKKEKLKAHLIDILSKMSDKDRERWKYTLE